METKTAKITSVQENQRQFEYQGTKYFEHYVKFEGSEFTWAYSSKSEKCDKFKVGDTATFDLEVREKNGTKFYKIKPKSDFKARTGEPKDHGVITYLSVFSSAAYYFAQRTCSEEDVFAMADRAYAKAMDKSTLNK